MYAQFFGTFLLSHNVVTKDQLLSALGKKSSQHMKLGTLAIMKGYMTANEVDNVIISQTHNDCRFGDLAVRECLKLILRLVSLFFKTSLKCSFKVSEFFHAGA